MQRTPINLFDKTITVQTLSQAGGSSHGEWTRTWSDALINIPARIQPKSSSFAMQHGAARERQTFVIYVETGQAIHAGQRVKFTDTDSKSRTCDILAVKEPQMADVVLRLECTEVLD